MNTSIFKIRSKFLHLEICSYLEKLSLLKIIKYSKKLQNFTDITLEDYEIYSIIQKNTLRKEKTLPGKLQRKSEFLIYDNNPFLKFNESSKNNKFRRH